MSVTLPPFPVHDSALDMLAIALNPGEDAERSSLTELLDFYSTLGGSDVSAVDEDDELNGDHVTVMRDPSYHHHDVITALAGEIRRLRGEMRAYGFDEVAVGGGPVVTS